MEASLLPSKEFRTLSSQVSVAAMRRYDPAGPGLMKELDEGFFGSCKAIVLDARGELLGSFSADDVDSECSAQSIARFAELFSARIADVLKETASLQELERRWQKEPEQLSAFDAYIKKLVDLSRDRLALSLAAYVSEDSGRSREIRSMARAWTFEQRGLNLELFTTSEERRSAYIAEGEALLVDFARYHAGRRLLEGLLHNGYGEQFDVPAKMVAVFARLEKVASLQPDPAPMRARLSELRDLLKEWKETVEELPKLTSFDEDSEGFAVIRGKLGDAKTVIRVFSELPEKREAPYRKWVREARAKLERER